jgi:hypothetical protein
VPLLLLFIELLILKCNMKNLNVCCIDFFLVLIVWNDLVAFCNFISDINIGLLQNFEFALMMYTGCIELCQLKETCDFCRSVGIVRLQTKGHRVCFVCGFTL